MDALRQLINEVNTIKQQIERTKIIEKARRVLGYVTTTNAGVTTLATVTIDASTTTFLEAHIAARRTGGVAGTAEDGAGYVIRATYKNVAGTPTLIGAINADYTAEDQAGWNATFVIGGATVIVQVTGAVNNNISWYCDVEVRTISS